MNGTVVLNITTSEIVAIAGPVDTSNPKRHFSQQILEAGQLESTITLLTQSSDPNNCRSVSASTTASTSMSGRTVLDLLISVDDSLCASKPQSRSKIVQIVVPSVIGGVILLTAAAVVAALKYPSLRRTLLPFWNAHS